MVGFVVLRKLTEETYILKRNRYLTIMFLKSKILQLFLFVFFASVNDTWVYMKTYFSMCVPASSERTYVLISERGWGLWSSLLLAYVWVTMQRIWCVWRLSAEEPLVHDLFFLYATLKSIVFLLLKQTGLILVKWGVSVTLRPYVYGPLFVVFT